MCLHVYVYFYNSSEKDVFNVFSQILIGQYDAFNLIFNAACWCKNLHEGTTKQTIKVICMLHKKTLLHCIFTDTTLDQKIFHIVTIKDCKLI